MSARGNRPPLILSSAHPLAQNAAWVNALNTLSTIGPVVEDTSANFPTNYPAGQYSQMMGYQTDTGAIYVSAQVTGTWTWVQIMTGPTPMTPTYTPYTFLPGLPTAGQCVLQWPCPGANLFPNGVTFPANIPDFGGALQVLPTATAVYTIYKVPAGTVIGTTAGAGTQIGTVSISTAGVFTVSTSGTAYTFTHNQVLVVWAPATADATLAGVSMTFVGSH